MPFFDGNAIIFIKLQRRVFVIIDFRRRLDTIARFRLTFIFLSTFQQSNLFVWSSEDWNPSPSHRNLTI